MSDAFLKENTDDQSHRIVEGMVIKRKRERTLFELPHPQKRRRLFSTWGKFCYTPAAKAQVGQTHFEGECG